MAIDPDLRTMPVDGLPPDDLNHAGVAVDKVIAAMVSQNVSSIAIASALLGGALGLLARSLPDEAVVGILSNAIGSVRAGELRAMTERDGARH